MNSLYLPILAYSDMVTGKLAKDSETLKASLAGRDCERCVASLLLGSLFIINTGFPIKDAQ